uniref:SET domain-containing protein n=1 Tax=Cyprinus carpio carpio TaxID=630221 RepID=A0A9J7Z745_CYPCA
MLAAHRNRRRTTPLQDAEHHISCKTDKTGLQEKFINKYKGRGVFSSEAFFRGDFVLEYRGELISQESLAPAEVYSEVQNTFLFDFQWHGKHWCMDASKEDGSLGRLVNDEHKNPTCKMRIITVNQQPHLCLFAVQDIKPGEEITYSYGDSDWPWRAKRSSPAPVTATSSSSSPVRRSSSPAPVTATSSSSSPVRRSSSPAPVTATSSSSSPVRKRSSPAPVTATSSSSSPVRKRSSPAPVTATSSSSSPVRKSSSPAPVTATSSSSSSSPVRKRSSPAPVTATSSSSSPVRKSSSPAPVTATSSSSSSSPVKQHSSRKRRVLLYTLYGLYNYLFLKIS